MLFGVATVGARRRSGTEVSGRMEEEEDEDEGLGEEPVRFDTTTDSRGRWAACVLAGAWTVGAHDDTCDADDERVEVIAGEDLELDFDVDADCDDEGEVDKPNLYLYPVAPTRTTVRLGLARGQRVLVSEPPYAGGWAGVALPDGTWRQAGEVAPFLFYEASLRSAQVAGFQREEGWCVSGPALDAVAAMAALLEAYAFTSREVDDFVEGWRFDMPDAPAYRVWPQRAVDHAVALSVEPQLRVERLWLVVEPDLACSPTPEPDVVPFDRDGPHGVEWGVMLDGFLR